MNTQLWNAVYTCNVDSTRILLQSGADANFEVMELSPLCMACANLHIDMIRLLLKNGANPSMTCPILTSKYLYKEIGMDSPMTIELISNSFGYDMYSPLMYILFGKCRFVTDTCQQKIIECSNILLNAGADITYKNENGDTAYIMAKNQGLHVSPILSEAFDIAIQKKYMYEPILTDIPINRNKLRYKLDSIGSKILCLHFRLKYQHATLNIDDIPIKIRDYLGITEEEHINRIYEFIPT